MVRRLGPATVFGFAATAVVIAVVWRGLWGQYWFDEVWRAARINSKSGFATPAPLPPGWVGAVRFLSTAIGTGAFAQRLTVVVTYVAAMAAASLTVAGLAPTGWQRSAAGVATITVFVLPSSTHLAGYLNNYVFDLLVGIALVAATTQLGRTRRSELVALALLTLCILTPVFGVGSLFLVPAAGLRLARWAWPRSRRWRTIVVGGGVVAAGSTALVGVTVWRPTLMPDLVSQWDRDSIHVAGWADAAQRASVILRVFLLNDRFEPLGRGDGWGFSGVVLGLALLGLVLLSRRNPWVAVLAVSALGLNVAISAVTAWPLSPERVNMAWVWLWLAAALYVPFAALGAVTTRLAAPTGARVFAALALVALLVVRADRESPDKSHLFPVGTSVMLQRVAASPYSENLVIVYPPELRYSAYDILVNRNRTQARFTVVPDVHRLDLAGSQAWNTLPAVAAQTAIWCIGVAEPGDHALRDLACREKVPGTVFVDLSSGKNHVLGWLAT